MSGWQEFYTEALAVLEDALDFDGDSEKSTKQIAVYKMFAMMGRDLEDLIEFARTTLPFDPWIIEHVQQALSEHPAFFTRKHETEDGRADAALPVPPGDEQPSVQ